MKLSISEIINSEMIFSAILSNVRRPVMFLKSFTVFGGKTLGIGVTVSFLYILGHCPSLAIVFRISQKGTDNSFANSLIILGGISPSGTDLFVLTFKK